MQNKKPIKFITVHLIFACLCLLLFTQITSCKKTVDGNDMNVILEISIADILKSLSNNSNDPDFQKIIAITDAKYLDSEKDYITLFAETWKEILPDKRMASFFVSYDGRLKEITSSSSDEDVIRYISYHIENAINNSFYVLLNRIDRLGVVVSNMQRINNSDRILIEIKGVKEPERVRKLLQGTASLEFWETFDCRRDGITQYIVDADKKIKELQDAEKSFNALNQIDTNMLEALQQNIDEQYPLLSILILNEDMTEKYERLSKACVGRARYSDTAKVNAMLALPQVSVMKSDNLRFAWTSKPLDPDGIYYELIALKLNPRFGNEAPLAGDIIVDAHKEFNQTNENPYPMVGISLNAQGAKIFAQLTKEAAGQQDEIAIVFDSYVYSYPKVYSEIEGGNIQITGQFSNQEADDLVNVLLSGKMPAHMRIIQEKIVVKQRK
ncbi:MAG: hypothetical protein LBC68_00015 [Prevotellaceae bacterium]|jgi:SecD/SecF fusion protein|nr:hypothetical protein [Prevotellaceae bacterium]